jgi:acetoin utilization deacetylase AcuC-like enzyme
MKPKFGLLCDNRYLHHAIERPSPENPERIRNLGQLVRERYTDTAQIYPAREATSAEIEAVHSRFYLDQVREHALRTNPFSYDPDTYLMEESYYTAQLAAGGCLEIADRIMAGEIRYGFAMVRPPGHHAEPGRGMGFCVLNNVGITANYLRMRYGLKRILILDVDVHHGNGTQEIFFESAEVLFVSLHQRGLFPFSGSEQETGREKGAGYTINIPVYPQSGDIEYTYLLGRLLQGVVEQFMPQIILVSAGYDGHQDDSISSMLLSTQWYGTLTAMLRQYAGESCEDRLMFVLEGGYNPESLEASVLATLDGLAASVSAKVGIIRAERVEALLKNHPLREYWTI